MRSVGGSLCTDRAARLCVRVAETDGGRGMACVATEGGREVAFLAASVGRWSVRGLVWSVVMLWRRLCGTLVALSVGSTLAVANLLVSVLIVGCLSGCLVVVGVRVPAQSCN